MESQQENQISNNTITESKPTKGAKGSNKQKDMKNLEKVFRKLDEKSIWSCYKQHNYDFQKTLVELAQISGEDVEAVKKRLPAKKTESTKKEEAEPQAKKKSMRTSEDIYRRIKVCLCMSHEKINNYPQWDSQYDSDEFVIGYEDRFDGIMECKLNAFVKDITDDNFIPWHRVIYFKQSGAIVWDRRTRQDDIFKSGQ